MAINECLVPIPWETRNLGVASFEVTQQFIDNPNEEKLKIEIKDKIEQHKSIFIQSRVAKEGYPVVAILERNDFYFVEAVLTPYTKIKENTVLEKFISDKSKFIPDCYTSSDWTVVQMNKEDGSLCLRIKEIATGSFSDDRFHVDSQCSEEIANSRFVFWVDDLLADEQVIFHTINYLGKAQGFMARKSNNLILAGFSKEFIGKGLAKFFWLRVLEDLQNKGFSQAYTLISTNNTPVLNLYTKLGFKFKNPAVTLHYWGED